jgi:tetratricopeptide (TPR) repeat protein
MIKNRIFFIVLCLLFALTKIDAQDVKTMLIVISDVFNTRQETLYNEAEDYLNTLSKDSIEKNLEIEILYHVDKAFLYASKYKDWEKSNQEFDYILDKIKPVKHLPEYSDSYKNLLRAYGYSLLNSGQAEKAITYFNKILVEGYDDECDMRLYETYDVLANIYERSGNLALSKSSHDKCQEILLKSYIKSHPEHSFYMDNYKSIKYAISQLESQNKTDTEDYVNRLCFLGFLLHKVDQGKYSEAMLTLLKARNCAIDNNLLKARGLEVCYTGLQEIFIRYIPEPTKSKFIEGLIPDMIDYFSEVLTIEDIYESVASSYGANQQYEKSIEYELKILSSIEKDSNSNREKLKRIYRMLVEDYLECGTDSTNKIAYEYLHKFKSFISEKETEYYEWYLINEGRILRYLHKNDDAIKCFKNNLSYYNKKYGKESDQYISNLNQLALCYPFDCDTFLEYLLEAKSLFQKTKEKKDLTLGGICVNLSRYYILKGRFDDARVELNEAVRIEKDTFGKILPVTQELINQCTEK